VVGAVAVVAGAVVEGDGVAELSRLEELHPAAIRATSTPGISRPTVMRRIPIAPSRFLVVARMDSLTRGCSDSNRLLAMRILASRYLACEAASGHGGADRTEPEPGGPRLSSRLAEPHRQPRSPGRQRNPRSARPPTGACSRHARSQRRGHRFKPPRIPRLPTSGRWPPLALSRTPVSSGLERLGQGVAWAADGQQTTLVSAGKVRDR
jgi:hypothetical protein